jgi:formate dehydrogenase subunit delta
MNVDKLVKMANQIAANSDYGPDKDKTAAVVADHLQRFWTPDMRAAIVAGTSRKLLDLSPVAARAVELLATRAGAQAKP